MNALMLVNTEGMDRQEWLEWRRQGIGGSDASVICGLNKWKSPMELWLEKTGQVEPKEAGEAAYWGTRMEPIIREEFTRKTGLEIEPMKAILQNPEYCFMLANLDGVVEDPVKGKGIFEAKTAGTYFAHEWDEGVPDYYEIQLQHYLGVTGLNYASLAVLIGGNSFQYYTIARNDAVITLLVELESHFWRLVETNTPPELDGSKASTELLKRLYPESKPNTFLELPLEALDLIEEFELAKGDEAEAIERKEGAANKLKEMMGEHENAAVGGRMVQWKTVSSERLDTKKLKLKEPEIYKEYLQRSSYRRFSIK